MNELDVVRSFDFDWAVHLSDIWADAPWDVSDLHRATREDFLVRLEQIRKAAHAKSPLGWILVGPGGAGKTHLLGRFRREAMRRKSAFVLVDMTDVRDFWDTVLQGYIGSLEKVYEAGLFQHQCLLRNMIERAGPNKPAANILTMMAERKSADLIGDMNKVLGVIHKTYPAETKKYQDIVRALICLNSNDFTIANLGAVWLKAIEVDDTDRRALGFTQAYKPPIEIVEALSWFMSLGGPTVVAFDQLDAIVTQYNTGLQAEDADPEERSVSRSIVQQIGGGLAALRERTFRTLTVVACLESSWANLAQAIPSAFLDRFDRPVHRLDAVKEKKVAESIVLKRLAVAFRDCGFQPPYPTWPFKPEAFESLKVNTPREVLQGCEESRKQWLREGKVTEVSQFGNGNVIVVLPPPNGKLDKTFATLKSQADPRQLAEEGHEDDRLAPILQSALQCLVHERELPKEIGAAVDRDFTGGDKTKPLHARLRLIFTKENEREEHYCLRALQHTNSRAFQSRLKAAITQSGIDRALKFRHLSIVRTHGRPGGAETQKLSEKLEGAGGQFLKPSDDELRALSALHQMRQAGDPDFEGWLRARRPVSALALIRAAVPSPLFIGPGDGAPENVVPTGTDVTPPPEPGSTPPVSPLAPTPPTPGFVPLGRRLVAGQLGALVELPAKLLEKHAFVVAGSGSGKTVLLRRLVEEAAIQGIPSVVIDIANDLTTLGDAWPTAPEGWGAGDVEKAKRYHEKKELIVWTPGWEAGNPLSFEPLPDLAAVCGDDDELNAAIEMVGESLGPIVAPGNSQASQNKRGILSHSLRAFAKGGGGKLPRFVAYLDDLQTGMGLGLADEAKKAKQMADGLKAAMATNPLLRSAGTPLDPAVLFGDDRPSDRTRVSVINLNVGTPTVEAKRHFLNQLAMTLFAWIKRNPDPGGRPLRGLLVIDEAKDFIPGTKATVCKESVLRLAAQARKYHLGLVLATQNPKEVDHRIMANCATHLYGKVNSPAAIAAVKELIQQKGGSGDDVAKLPRGQFYAHNADAGLPAPVKVAVPLCLSRAPESPPDDAGVLQRATASREQLARGRA